VTLDHIQAKQWKEILVTSGIDAQTLSCYGGYEDLVLRWAEAIPVWYLQKYITNGLPSKNCLRTIFSVSLSFSLSVKLSIHSFLYTLFLLLQCCC